MAGDIFSSATVFTPIQDIRKSPGTGMGKPASSCARADRAEADRGVRRGNDGRTPAVETVMRILRTGYITE
jgi:hypothetical protein